MTESADIHLTHASQIVREALAEAAKRPHVDPSLTPRHHREPRRSRSAVEGLRDHRQRPRHDAASGRTVSASAQSLIDYVKSESLEVQWLLETHAMPTICRPRPSFRRRSAPIGDRA